MDVLFGHVVITTGFFFDTKPPALRGLVAGVAEQLDSRSKTHYQSIYNQNFFNQIYPETHRPRQGQTFRASIQPDAPLQIRVKGFEGVNFAVDGWEVYMYGLNVGVVSMHLGFEETTTSEFTDVLRQLRWMQTQLDCQGKSMTLRQVLSKGMEDWGTRPELRHHIWSFVNLQITESDYSPEHVPDVAYDVCNLITPDSLANLTSEEYKQEMMALGGVSIFQNWFALCANDAFVRIASNADPFERWKSDYLSVFLYSNLVREYLAYMNSVLANVTDLGDEVVKKRLEFIEFLNDSQFHDISSKFLPNQLFRSIFNALELPEEMQIVEKKLSRISNVVQDKRDKSLNTALMAITFLSLFSVFLDASLWVDKLGGAAWVWPTGSLIISGSLLLALILYFYTRMKR
jgi:hypothetical protein